jgi:alanine racemase
LSSLVWVELDRSAPEHNLAELRRGAAPGVKFCAVVKANAYGHGMAEMAGLLPSADWFAVNSLEEGLELRGMGVAKPVVLLGHVPFDRLGEAVSAGLALTVYNTETIDRLASLPASAGLAKVHVKVETGTGRQGVLAQDLEAFLVRAQAARNLRIEGLSTHFANIEDTLNHGYAEKQLEIFAGALRTAERCVGTPPVVHTACTAASILFPKTHFTMLRVGIGLYGLWPSRETYLSALQGSAPVSRWVKRSP